MACQDPVAGLVAELRAQPLAPPPTPGLLHLLRPQEAEGSLDRVCLDRACITLEAEGCGFWKLRALPSILHNSAIQMEIIYKGNFPSLCYKSIRTV